MSRERAYRSERRSGQLAEWHGYLLERLVGSDAEDRIDRLVRHPALDGPELWFVDARWAQMKGDLDRARHLATHCLDKLPGHTRFLKFAREVGAAIPKRAQELAGQ